MSNARRLEEKDPGETVPLSWDFTDDVGEQDSPAVEITSATVTIAVDRSLFRGSDADVAAMLVGEPQIDGMQVIQAVTAGVHRVDYKVKCAAVMSSTPVATIYKTSILPVRNQ